MIRAGVLDRRRVELLRGDIYEMTPEEPSHSFYGGSLADRFRHSLRDRALVREARPVTFSNSELEPDIAIVRGVWDDYRLRHPQPEDIFLVVEISESSLNYDLELKRKVYATAIVPEYWVVDLKNRRVVVFREPKNGDYRSRSQVQEGAIVPLAFPDVEISVFEN